MQNNMEQRATKDPRRVGPVTVNVETSKVKRGRGPGRRSRRAPVAMTYVVTYDRPIRRSIKKGNDYTGLKIRNWYLKNKKGEMNLPETVANRREIRAQDVLDSQLETPDRKNRLKQNVQFNDLLGYESGTGAISSGDYQDSAYGGSLGNDGRSGGLDTSYEPCMTEFELAESEQFAGTKQFDSAASIAQKVTPRIEVSLEPVPETVLKTTPLGASVQKKLGAGFIGKAPVINFKRKLIGFRATPVDLPVDGENVTFVVTHKDQTQNPGLNMKLRKPRITLASSKPVKDPIGTNNASIDTGLTKENGRNRFEVAQSSYSIQAKSPEVAVVIPESSSLEFPVTIPKDTKFSEDPVQPMLIYQVSHDVPSKPKGFNLGIRKKSSVVKQKPGRKAKVPQEITFSVAHNIPKLSGVKLRPRLNISKRGKLRLNKKVEVQEVRELVLKPESPSFRHPEIPAGLIASKSTFETSRKDDLSDITDDIKLFKGEVDIEPTQLELRSGVSSIRMPIGTPMTSADLIKPQRLDDWDASNARPLVLPQNDDLQWSAPDTTEPRPLRIDLSPSNIELQPTAASRYALLNASDDVGLVIPPLTSFNVNLKDDLDKNWLKSEVITPYGVPVESSRTDVISPIMPEISDRYIAEVQQPSFTRKQTSLNSRAGTEVPLSGSFNINMDADLDKRWESPEAKASYQVHVDSPRIERPTISPVAPQISRSYDMEINPTSALFNARDNSEMPLATYFNVDMENDLNKGWRVPEAKASYQVNVDTPRMNAKSRIVPEISKGYNFESPRVDIYSHNIPDISRNYSLDPHLMKEDLSFGSAAPINSAFDIQSPRIQIPGQIGYNTGAFPNVNFSVPDQTLSLDFQAPTLSQIGMSTSHGSEISPLSMPSVAASSSQMTPFQIETPAQSISYTVNYGQPKVVKPWSIKPRKEAVVKRKPGVQGSPKFKLKFSKRTRPAIKEVQTPQSITYHVTYDLPPPKTTSKMPSSEVDMDLKLDSRLMRKNLDPRLGSLSLEVDSEQPIVLSAAPEPLERYVSDAGLRLEESLALDWNLKADLESPNVLSAAPEPLERYVSDSSKVHAGVNDSDFGMVLPESPEVRRLELRPEVSTVRLPQADVTYKVSYEQPQEGWDVGITTPPLGFQDRNSELDLTLPNVEFAERIDFPSLVSAEFASSGMEFESQQRATFPEFSPLSTSSGFPATGIASAKAGEQPQSITYHITYELPKPNRAQSLKLKRPGKASREFPASKTNIHAHAGYSAEPLVSETAPLKPPVSITYEVNYGPLKSKPMWNLKIRKPRAKKLIPQTPFASARVEPRLEASPKVSLIKRGSNKLPRFDASSKFSLMKKRSDKLPESRERSDKSPKIVIYQVNYDRPYIDTQWSLKAPKKLLPGKQKKVPIAKPELEHTPASIEVAKEYPQASVTYVTEHSGLAPYKQWDVKVKKPRPGKRSPVANLKKPVKSPPESVSIEQPRFGVGSHEARFAKISPVSTPSSKPRGIKDEEAQISVTYLVEYDTPATFKQWDVKIKKGRPSKKKLVTDLKKPISGSKEQASVNLPSYDIRDYYDLPKASPTASPSFRAKIPEETKDKESTMIYVVNYDRPTPKKILSIKLKKPSGIKVKKPSAKGKVPKIKVERKLESQFRMEEEATFKASLPAIPEITTADDEQEDERVKADVEIPGATYVVRYDTPSPEQVRSRHVGEPEIVVSSDLIVNVTYDTNIERPSVDVIDDESMYRPPINVKYDTDAAPAELDIPSWAVEAGLAATAEVSIHDDNWSERRAYLETDIDEITEVSARTKMPDIIEEPETPEIQVVTPEKSLLSKVQSPSVRVSESLTPVLKVNVSPNIEEKDVPQSVTYIIKYTTPRSYKEWDLKMNPSKKSVSKKGKSKELKVGGTLEVVDIDSGVENEKATVVLPPHAITYKVNYGSTDEDTGLDVKVPKNGKGKNKLSKKDAKVETKKVKTQSGKQEANIEATGEIESPGLSTGSHAKPAKSAEPESVTFLVKYDLPIGTTSKISMRKSAETAPTTDNKKTKAVSKIQKETVVDEGLSQPSVELKAGLPEKIKGKSKKEKPELEQQQSLTFVVKYNLPIPKVGKQAEEQDKTKSKDDRINIDIAPLGEIPAEESKPEAIAVEIPTIEVTKVAAKESDDKQQTIVTYVVDYSLPKIVNKKEKLKLSIETPQAGQSDSTETPKIKEGDDVNLILQGPETFFRVTQPTPETAAAVSTSSKPPLEKINKSQLEKEKPEHHQVTYTVVYDVFKKEEATKDNVKPLSIKKKIKEDIKVSLKTKKGTEKDIDKPLDNKHEYEFAIEKPLMPSTTIEGNVQVASSTPSAVIDVHQMPDIAEHAAKEEPTVEVLKILVPLMIQSGTLCDTLPTSTANEPEKGVETPVKIKKETNLIEINVEPKTDINVLGDFSGTGIAMNPVESITISGEIVPLEVTQNAEVSAAVVLEKEREPLPKPVEIPRIILQDDDAVKGKHTSEKEIHIPAIIVHSEEAQIKRPDKPKFNVEKVLDDLTTGRGKFEGSDNIERNIYVGAAPSDSIDDSKMFIYFRRTEKELTPKIENKDEFSEQAKKIIQGGTIDVSSEKNCIGNIPTSVFMTAPQSSVGISLPQQTANADFEISTEIPEISSSEETLVEGSSNADDTANITTMPTISPEMSKLVLNDDVIKDELKPSVEILGASTPPVKVETTPKELPLETITHPENVKIKIKQPIPILNLDIKQPQKDTPVKENIGGADSELSAITDVHKTPNVAEAEAPEEPTVEVLKILVPLIQSGTLYDTSPPPQRVTYITKHDPDAGKASASPSTDTTKPSHVAEDEPVINCFGRQSFGKPIKFSETLSKTTTKPTLAVPPRLQRHDKDQFILIKSDQDQVIVDPIPTAETNKPPSRHFVVVAIDFGTTYSGYAFRFTADKGEGLNIMRQWEGGDPGALDLKIPTTLLLTPKGEFHSFGFMARNHFHDLSPEEAKRWMYFEKFKMALHFNAELNLNTEITASNGQRYPALKIFSLALKFFRDHALQDLSEQSSTTLVDEDVQWLITVPAIWKNPAKQFMRQAAYEAGIASPSNPTQLLISLEPEAASICVRREKFRELIPESPPLLSHHMRNRRSLTPGRRSVTPCGRGFTAVSANEITDRTRRHSEPRTIGRGIADSDTQEASEAPPTSPASYLYSDMTVGQEVNVPGTRYMLVDCGGGTVDITLHEIQSSDGGLIELHRATGGAYGSLGIDREFERLLTKIFGEDFIKAFRERRPAGWVDLMMAFESRKRAADPTRPRSLNVSLPFSFIDFHKKFRNSTVESMINKYGDKSVTWTRQGMLRLDHVAMETLFEPTLSNIITTVSDVINSNMATGVKYLFLVGGLSESPMLQTAIRRTFSPRLKVLIPYDVSLAVLKGAVSYGCDPSLVTLRKSRLTYGVAVHVPYNKDHHPKSKLVTRDGKQWCVDIFDALVLTDQSLYLGQTVTRGYTLLGPTAGSAGDGDMKSMGKTSGDYEDGVLNPKGPTGDLTPVEIAIYSSESRRVQFVTDRDVKRCGIIRLEIPQTSGVPASSKGPGFAQPTGSLSTGGARNGGRGIELAMTFGNTEITVTAVDSISGNCIRASIDFFNQ